MKNTFGVIAVGGLLFYTNTALAISGTNITVYDDNSNPTSSSSWYKSLNEDQEVEPGNVTTQKWDLEGFFLDGTRLTLVGGFDFKNGVDGYYGGDIFIDVNGDAQYGSDVTSPYSTNGYRTVLNTLGYDYAIDLSFDGSILKYALVEFDSNTTVITPYFKANYGSGPYKYDSTGNILLGNQTGTYQTGLSDGETGFMGDYSIYKTHNALTIDLAYLFDILGYGKEFTVSYTMGCGNDHIVGQGTTPVPEPATMLLFGTGLAGLAGIARRRTKR